MIARKRCTTTRPRGEPANGPKFLRHEAMSGSTIRYRRSILPRPSLAVSLYVVSVAGCVEASWFRLVIPPYRIPTCTKWRLWGATVPRNTPGFFPLLFLSHQRKASLACLGFLGSLSPIQGSRVCVCVCVCVFTGQSIWLLWSWVV